MARQMKNQHRLAQAVDHSAVRDALLKCDEVLQKSIVLARPQDGSDEPLQRIFVGCIGQRPTRVNHGLAHGFNGVCLQPFHERRIVVPVGRPHAQKRLV